MARCSRCSCPDVTSCLCSMADNDCFNISGTGTALDPFTIAAILNSSANNILSCGVGGLLAEVPSRIRNPPTVALTRSTTQTIPSGPTQLIGFNVERWDTDSMHDNVTNNSRITINTAGVYVLSASVKWQANASNDRRIEFRVNSADLICSDEQTVTQADDFNQSIATIWKMAAGDYVELQVKQNSGVDLVIRSEGDVSPEMRACLIGVG